MEEKDTTQKELFKEFSQSGKRPGRFSWFKRPIAFRPLVFIFSYEKFIFLIIILLIILTVIFSLGVEQGKRIAQAIKTPTDTILPTVTLPATPLKITPPSVKEQKEIVKETFTIQLATFAEKSLAEKEMVNLKNKGYQSFLAISGKYYLVCLGSFNDKEQAKVVLTKLKTIYKDAYIKKRQ